MRNYIIIGGSSGIGKELVNLLEDQGGEYNCDLQQECR